jgi:CYTH domain-containing protein
MNVNGREIERKYLLRALPRDVAAHPSAVIDQGYIPGTLVRERVRRIEEGNSVKFVRTIKLGSGMDRLEFEEDTTEAFFAAVWPLTAGHRVRKRRYRVPVPDGVWEVDEFLDRDDLILAEIELTSVDQYIDPTPEIADVMVREVTHEPSFTNYKLSR